MMVSKRYNPEPVNPLFLICLSVLGGSFGIEPPEKGAKPGVVEWLLIYHYRPLIADTVTHFGLKFKSA